MISFKKTSDIHINQIPPTAFENKIQSIKIRLSLINNFTNGNNLPDFTHKPIAEIIVTIFVKFC